MVGKAISGLVSWSGSSSPIDLRLRSLNLCELHNHHPKRSINDDDRQGLHVFTMENSVTIDFQEMWVTCLREASACRCGSAFILAGERQIHALLSPQIPAPNLRDFTTFQLHHHCTSAQPLVPVLLLTSSALRLCLCPNTCK